MKNNQLIVCLATRVLAIQPVLMKENFPHEFFFIKEFKYLLNQILINEVGQHFVPNV
jgi:hypothetical protein